MKLRIQIICVLLLSFLVEVVEAQKSFTFCQGEINQSDYFETIPFEFVLGKIVVEAKIEGKKGRFILDTGAMCILFKYSTKEQNFDVLRTMNLKDANKKSKKAEVVKVESIQIGGLVYSDIPALYIDEFEGALKCFEVDGLLGSNLLRFGAFKVDVQRQEVILADSYQDFGLSRDTGIKMKNNKVQSSPHIALKLNGVKQKHILVDTGSNGIYAFSNKVSAKMQRKGKFDHPAYTSSGTNSQGAWGVDGSEKVTKIWQVDALELNGTFFTKNLLRSDEASSRIGMSLLDQGEFVLDYPQERFFFLPYEDKENSLSIGGFGIDLASINDTLKVNGIWSGTEAERSELEKGDILIDVTELDFPDNSLCTMFFELKKQAKKYNELEFVFLKPDTNKELRLKLKRIE